MKRALILLCGFLLGGMLNGGAVEPWQTNGPARFRPVEIAPNGRDGFTAIAPRLTGVSFTNVLPPAKSLTNQVFLNGAGVAAGDYDGDGWTDLFFCSLDGQNRLFRNLGNWKFEDATARLGLDTLRPDSTSAAFVDLNGDGWLDLIFNTIGRGSYVFINDGAGHFTDQTGAYHFSGTKCRTSMAFADINGDGYLDCYVAAYRRVALMDMPLTRFDFKVVNGKQVIDRINGRPATDPEFVNRFHLNERGVIDEAGEPDDFYLNKGGKTFEPISFTDGTFLDEQGKALRLPPMDWGLSVLFRDVNGDLSPDLYICNDFDSPDRLWLNDGKGHFRAIPQLHIRKMSLFAMGVDFADINRDGRDDFFVLDMLSRDHAHRLNQVGDRKPYVPVPGEIGNRPAYSRNTLFLQREDGSYAEIAALSGLEASDWSWGAIFLDVDLDGWEDLLISNGHGRDARNADVANQLREMRSQRSMTQAEIFAARALFPPLDTPNAAYRNNHDLTFTDMGKAWGFDQQGVSHGMALADLDNDADLDVILNNLNAPASLLRNESARPRVAVVLRGNPPNPFGIGARIKLIGRKLTQSQEMISGGRYLSGDAPIRAFAALEDALEIEVRWRSGTVSRVKNIRPNCLVEIRESGAHDDSGPSQPTRAPAPLFEDVSQLLGHRHVENNFDDFQRQPLLPFKLSQPGPGISWFDLDGDGRDDLIIPAGKGGTITVLRNLAAGGFRPGKGAWSQVLNRDCPEICVVEMNNLKRIFALLSNYEDGQAGGPALRQIAPNSAPDDSVLATGSSYQSFAIADIDGDGFLDLFVAGRVRPGQYPAPADSAIFLQKDGHYQAAPDQTSLFARVGLVNAALFSDLNGDGWSDLILACEWGPLRIFYNNQGKFREATSSLGFDKFAGFWNGISTGDFDGDGRPDIVAANWGSNTPWQRYRTGPLRLWYGDADSNGTIELAEGYFNRERQAWLPIRDLGFLARGFQQLPARFKTHSAFAQASVEQLWPNLASVQRLEANWLETTVFLNRGDHFDARPLPVEAQFSSVFGTVVSDFDGDGFEDIFLAENFFAVHPEISRMDGGRGLVVKGLGNGSFRALSAEESGCRIYGEQRGAAACDFDLDGRMDLAVGQNGAQTMLFRNVAGKPGLRVRLIGPEPNRTAIGATLRIQYGEKWGPLREIQSTTGYLSQSSPVQLFSRAAPATGLWVRWPGGQTNLVQIPREASEIELDANGKLSGR